MDLQGTDKAHFFSLPAELRNHVYAFVLEDTHDFAVDVLSWRSILPTPSITAVNRQTRSESLCLYEEAKDDVWKSHQWTLYINRTFCLRRKRYKQATAFCLVSYRLPSGLIWTVIRLYEPLMWLTDRHIVSD